MPRNANLSVVRMTLLAAAAGSLFSSTANAQSLRWVRTYDGGIANQDKAMAVAHGPGGVVAVTGLSKGAGTDWDYATVLYDAEGSVLWTARYNGPDNGIDEALAVGVDAQGNVYVTGNSFGGVGPQASDWDYATIKYNAAGQQQWVRRYNGQGNLSDTVTNMVVDDAGNCYLSGFVFKQFDPFNRFATHFHVLKYDTNGNIVWDHQLDRTPHYGAGARGVFVDAQGNTYATGVVNDSDGWSNDNNMMSVKIDPAGNIVYSVEYTSSGGNTGNDDSQLVTADAQGNAYIAGQTYFDGYRTWDTTVVKYSPTGAFQWARVVELDRPDGPSGIDTDAAGNVYIGWTWNKLQDDDGFAVSFSPSGAERWRRFIDGGEPWGSDACYGLRVGPDGDVYAAAEVQYASGYDITLNRFTPAGDLVARTNYDAGSTSDVLWGENTCLDFAPDGSAYVVGTRFSQATASDYAVVRAGGSTAPACYANCDQSSAAPVLNVADFTCFLQRFAAGESYANCDQSTAAPVLNVADFTCFLQRFAAGCP